MIQPRLWPRIEFFSSRGQEPRYLCVIQQQPFISGARPGSFRTALVLCSPSEHVFRCTLLTLWCGCVNEWNVLHETSEEPCSAVPRWPHTAYGRNLSGVYTDLPMPRGTQHLLQEPTRNGQSVSTKLSFLGQTFQSLWPFHNSWGIRCTT